MRRVTCTSKQLRLVLENTHACGLAEAHLTVLCESGKVTHHLQEGLRDDRGARGSPDEGMRVREPRQPLSRERTHMERE